MEFTGIYWIGPIFSMGGYGNVSRNLLKAVEKLKIPILLHNIGQPNYFEIGEETKNWLNNLSKSNIGERVLLIQHNLPEGFIDPKKIANVVKNVGITIFETDRIPEHWISSCNQMDEIWVPSAFNIATFTHSGVSREKLKLLPYAIDTDQFYPGKPYYKLQFSEPIKTFKFLYTSAFDFRKGYDLLIRSFCKTFSKSDDVALVLKINIPAWTNLSPSEVYQILHSYIPTSLANEPPQIVIIVDNFTSEQLQSLYQSCDVYVTTDRANGWGMPAMEMMALGKPIITINWSGSTQFANKHNSYLIQPENELEAVYESLELSRPQNYKGHKWAKVKDETVSAVLRDAYINKEKRDQIAKQAALDMQEKYSADAISKHLKRLLE